MPNAVLGSRPSSTSLPPPTLLEKVMGGVTRASPKEETELFKTHPYYAEVKGNKFYVNEARLEKEGSTGDFIPDVQLFESLHRLRDTAPESHSRLQKAAADDPAVQQWKRDSYDYVTGKTPDERGRYIPKDQREKRSIDQWWNESRFDQVVGGFLLGGPDANLSTMRNWDRESLPFGTKFRRELETFEKALGRTPKKFDPEGSGYDYATAKADGLTPDETGHWPSRSPKTGQLLKGRKHPTYHKTVAGEEKAGYTIRQGEDGRYYSRRAGETLGRMPTK